MTTAALSIIARMREAGATLECKDGGRVRFSAPAPLPAALLAEARKHREAIAAALTADVAESSGTRDVANVWGFTPADRAIALARLGLQRSHSLAATLTSDGLPRAPDGAPRIAAACVEGVAAEALDNYEALEPLADGPEAERERLQADGYRGAALQRPPSWWQALVVPRRVRLVLRNVPSAEWHQREQHARGALVTRITEHPIGSCWRRTRPVRSENAADYTKITTMIGNGELHGCG